MPDVVNQVANAIAEPADSPTASLRVATVTAVETTGSFRAQTDATGTAWLTRDADTLLTIGDKVWIIQQGAVWLIGGRLEGGPATPIGVVNPFAGSVAPPGWLICNGQAVSRTTYNALFATIGTAYGSGDGSTTFNVPNLTNRVPVGSGGSYAQTATGGAATVALSTAQLPAHDHGSAGNHNHGAVGDHSHSINIGPGVQGEAGSVRNYYYDAAGQYRSTDGAGGHSHGDAGSHTHASVGSGQAHENMPPFLAIPYIIRAL